MGQDSYLCLIDISGVNICRKHIVISYVWIDIFTRQFSAEGVQYLTRGVKLEHLRLIPSRVRSAVTCIQL